jgi:hypothetical protein
MLLTMEELNYTIIKILVYYYTQILEAVDAVHPPKSAQPAVIVAAAAAHSNPNLFIYAYVGVVV